ncbi:unnamed protein product [Blepharisma stoltei]|uniref:Uncharacterized protein n=1 Tax=Blepharisma stoltei TaxID=1481888 RepID=A0AAU9JYY2_9CILI|nr:unnamed protein product [Blepharisma stoltei]
MINASSQFYKEDDRIPYLRDNSYLYGERPLNLQPEPLEPEIFESFRPTEKAIPEPHISKPMEELSMNVYQDIDPSPSLNYSYTYKHPKVKQLSELIEPFEKTSYDRTDYETNRENTENEWEQLENRIDNLKRKILLPGHRSKSKSLRTTSCLEISKDLNRDQVKKSTMRDLGATKFSNLSETRNLAKRKAKNVIVEKGKNRNLSTFSREMDRMDTFSASEEYVRGLVEIMKKHAKKYPGLKDDIVLLNKKFIASNKA